MKKVLFSLLCIMAFASFSFAAEEMISSTGGVSAFPGDSSYINNAFVADWEVNGGAPTQIIKSGNGAFVRYGIHVGITQIFHRHYIITNPAGTMVGYAMFSSTLVAGTDNNIGTVFYLPDGDYTFTFVAAGAQSGMAVINQVRFSVR